MQNRLENISKEMFWRKLMLSALLPFIFVSLLWIIRFLEYEFALNLTELGVYPRNFKGLHGIITSVFIHKDASHLFNNSFPLLILGTVLFYFYPELAFKLIIYSWLISGGLVWITGRSAWHIGASGLVYSLVAFLFVSGIIRRYFRLMALSLLVIFIYGSMVWGMFPFIDVHISWEAHMMGAFSGTILAFWYREAGPQRPPDPEWMNDDDETDDFYSYEETINN